MSIFSERLQQVLAQKEITQKELASRAGVTESAISYYMKGQRTPSGDVLTRIAIALDTTTDYLLGNSSNSTPPAENDRLQFLQRKLGELDEERLEKAETMLKVMFDDLFENSEV